MSTFPAIPLFVDAWVADTSHLSRAERGLYLDLLTLMWRTPECRVPNEIEWIARRLRCSDDELPMLRQIIAEFCQSTGNWITQKRLKKEYDFVFAKSAKNRKAAQERWAKESEVDVIRKLEPKKTNDTDKSLKNNVVELCERNAPTPTPTPTPIASASNGKDVFARVDAALRSIEEVRGHPIAADPVIGHIVTLVEKGYDLTTQVIPSIRRQIAKRQGKPISRWSYFVAGIVEDYASTDASNAPPPKDLELWTKRLKWAREHRQWPYTAWGPPPGRPTCRAPAALLLPEDGIGWGEYRAAE